jgi:flagellin-like protein
MKTFRKLSRRAISPLIATIILIAICVAGGLLVYTIFFSTAGTITSKGQLTVEAVDLVKAADGTTFSITIKNSGNKPLGTTSALTIKLGGETAAWDVTADAKNLQPGQSVSYVNSSLAGNYVVGNVYTVVIQATFSDGSTFSTTTSVQCRSG